MFDSSVYFTILFAIVTLIVSAFVLYGVIRLAVAHAIVAARPRAATTARPTSHLDEDGL